MEGAPINPFKDNGCTSNQLIGFYMIRASSINEIRNDIDLQREKGMRLIQLNTICRSSRPWVFLRKGVLKIDNKFTRKHP